MDEGKEKGFCLYTVFVFKSPGWSRGCKLASCYRYWGGPSDIISSLNWIMVQRVWWCVMIVYICSWFKRKVWLWLEWCIGFIFVDSFLHFLEMNYILFEDKSSLKHYQTTIFETPVIFYVSVSFMIFGDHCRQGFWGWMLHII